MQPVGGIFELGRLVFRLAGAGCTLSRRLHHFQPLLAHFGNNHAIPPLFRPPQVDRVALIVRPEPGVVRRNFDYPRVSAPRFFAQIDAVTGADRCDL